MPWLRSCRGIEVYTTLSASLGAAAHNNRFDGIFGFLVSYPRTSHDESFLLKALQVTLCGLVRSLRDGRSSGEMNTCRFLVAPVITRSRDEVAW